EGADVVGAREERHKPCRRLRRGPTRPTDGGAHAIADASRRPAASTHAMNTPCTGSRAHSARDPPGIFEYCSGCSAMWRLAGNTPINVATSHHPAGRRVRPSIRPAPPAISAAPLAATIAAGAGTHGGII